VAKRVKENGNTIHLKTPFDAAWIKKYDATIVTTPSKIFTHMFPKLPEEHTKRLTSIPHLHALNLLLITKKPFLPNVYWLNINDRSFPFIAVVQHTNMVDSKHYGGNHITWIGNYLPQDHPYLKMTKKELFKTFLPYLKRINSSFNFDHLTLNFELFMGPFAQPVFPINYSHIKPEFETPIPHVYLANMDMVYPWDRGTNYAIELGYNVAETVMRANTTS
jgi:protoporphyrinogen oxidase